MAVCAGGFFEQLARKDELTEQLRQGPGEAATRVNAVGAKCPAPGLWTVARIRASVDWLADYSLSGVWRVLQRLDLGLRSAQVRRYSPDPDYLRKKKRLERALRDAARHPKQVVALFLDEFGYYRWPAGSRNWGPSVAGRDGNNQQWRAIGALNALTGQVDYLDNYIVGRRQMIQFYERLVQRYPRAQRIYLIQDNWNIHTHPDVLTALATWPQLRPVGLPTYSPWLNPIEERPTDYPARACQPQQHRSHPSFPSLGGANRRGGADLLPKGRSNLLRYRAAGRHPGLRAPILDRPRAG